MRIQLPVNVLFIMFNLNCTMACRLFYLLLSQLTLYPYEEFDFGVFVDEPLALPCLGIIGMPKFPSQPNKGVRLSFDAISKLFMY